MVLFNVILLLAAVITFCESADPSRTQVSIDLGWRFWRGVPPPSSCTTLSNFTGMQCSGLNAVTWAAGQHDCQKACCADPSCQVWQWSQKGGGCWIGVIPPQGCETGRSEWISYANTSRSVPAWATLSYDDGNWSTIDAPHDFIITGADETSSPYVNDSDLQGQAFIPKTVGVYRKHFQLPVDWSGTHVELYCEGMYAYASYYLNGVFLGLHPLGYTSFSTRLDNITGGLLFGPGHTNVIAIYVDATLARDTGWWYEGGGAMRHTFLYSTSSAVHVMPHGLHYDVAILGVYQYPNTPADGVTASSVNINAFADVETDGTTPANFVAKFTLYAADGVTVVATSAAPTSQAPATSMAVLQVPQAECWSVARPYLYTLSISLSLASAHSVVLDSVNTTLGVRAVKFDADQGVLINEQRVRFRAFCDHESFAAVGMAVPDRVNLFRFQAMRGMGGNGRRFSHNPPAPALLDLADRLGIMTLDENRVFALGLASNMLDLVTRDRNHPSVVFWSFCNEPGCNNADRSAPTQPTQDFKYAVEIADGTRAVTGNMCVNWGDCPLEADYMAGLNMSFQLDVQGFSHVTDYVFSAYHQRWPAKPLVGSECCSCETQRGEDNDIPYNKTNVFYSNFNADCVREQTQWALSLPYVAGSFVWTAFDYYGEPDAWPHVSSSFGSFDLAGFPKAAVWWYRSWWLANVSTTSADRPPLPASTTSTFAYIVEGWRAIPNSPTTNRTIHVYTNAPFASLTLNGALMGTQAITKYGAWATFSVAFVPGTLMATGFAADGHTKLASFSRTSWGAPRSIKIVIDVPSVATGTGTALFLDGQDTAMLRAIVVDDAGVLCEDATNTVTFAVKEGPGSVLGTGNGDPANHDPNHATSRAAYHGLVRAMVKVTQASAVASQWGAGAPDAVSLLQMVNVDAGRGGRSSPVVPLPTGSTPPPITVTATSVGLIGDSATIATSVDWRDGVLQTAASNVGTAFIGE